MINAPDINATLDRMAAELKALLAQRAIRDPMMVGIHTGGVWVARQLHQRLGLTQPLGELDISFYRDDFTRIGINPQVKPSSLPRTLDDQYIILVDDVLHTGRTVRAALNEIFDWGRPASVLLVALVDRGGRELPVEACVVGERMPLQAHEHVKLSGPQPLKLTVLESP